MTLRSTALAPARRAFWISSERISPSVLLKRRVTLVTAAGSTWLLIVAGRDIWGSSTSGNSPPAVPLPFSRTAERRDRTPQYSSACLIVRPRRMSNASAGSFEPHPQLGRESGWDKVGQYGQI